MSEDFAKTMKLIENLCGNTGNTAQYEERKEFNLRVASYIEGQKWANRPTILSPSVCARHGWKCISSNLLECVSCHAKLCIQEPKKEINAYKACIEKIISDLKGSHTTHCPWSIDPCPEYFVKMEPLPKENALFVFTNRYESYVETPQSIPQMSDIIPSLLGLEDKKVEEFSKLLKKSFGEDQKAIKIPAFCMAATGWKLKSENNKDKKIYIKCYDCQRTIWAPSLKLIGSSDSVTKNSSSEEDVLSPQKKFKLEKVEFHPLEEHRPWCLWITPSSCKLKQKDSTNEKALLPGWKVFINSLMKNLVNSEVVDSLSKPEKTQLKSVWDALDSWGNFTSS